MNLGEMIMPILNIVLVCLLFVSYAKCYFVTISHNGPVVLGANITFKAELFNALGESPSGTFLFLWRDNAIPQHQSVSKDSGTVAVWNVSYPSPTYGPGPYEVQVIVDEVTWIVWHIGSQRTSFNVTAFLNGEMQLEQRGNTEVSSVVSSAHEVNHTIKLSTPDRNYVTKEDMETITYWFIDCVYFGQSSDFSFAFNYTQPGLEHDVEALIISSHEEPVTTTVPSTTSTTAKSSSSLTTDISVNTTVTSVTQTTPITINSSVPINSSSTMKPIYGSSFAPFVCHNKSIIPPDPNKTYGYFYKHISVRASVGSVIVLGSNWLQHGDVLNLNVTCNGSSKFSYCHYTYSGTYNITGDETCVTPRDSEQCKFSLVHYFRQPGTYTVVIIISNEVSKIVKPVAINVYEVTRQPQLSVIVVPVTCSLLAAIIIVFGVAYYIQSRNRYTVEVADFDFGQANDMAYETFRERLHKGIVNAFTRNSAQSTSTAWAPSNKYSNMQ